MKDPGNTRRRVRRTVTAILITGFAVSVTLAYRWAALPGSDDPRAALDPRSPTLRLTEAPFSAYSGGRLTWSLWAGSIDIDRMSEASLSSAQHAILANIRDGKLFGESAPKKPRASVAKDGRIPVTPAAQSASAAPVALFSARSGVYALGLLETLPPEITLNYDVEWQFKLRDHVDFRTISGDRLRANELTMLEMHERRTRKLERRILCDEGAQITFQDVRIQANRLRYNPADRTVECLDGVRAFYRDGSLQAERLFWSLKDRVIHCPDMSTGVARGAPFTAYGLEIDLKRRVLRANRLECKIHMEKGEAFRLLPGR